MSLQHSHKFASPHDNYDYSSSITIWLGRWIISKVFLALCDMCAGVITPIYSFVFALRNTLPPLPRRHHQGNLDQSLSLMTAWPLAWPATVMEPTTTSTQAFRSASESFADCVSFLRLLFLNKDEYAKWGKHQSFLTRIFQMYPRRRYLFKSILFCKIPDLSRHPIPEFSANFVAFFWTLLTVC